MVADSKNSITELTKRNLAFPIIIKLISFTSSAVVVWLLGRHLAIEEFGIYNILKSLVIYLAIFSSLGIPALIYRFFPELHEKGELGYVRHLTFCFIVLRSLVILGIYLLLVVTYNSFIGRFFNLTGYESLFILWFLFVLSSINNDTLYLAFTSLFLHRYYTLVFTSYLALRAGLIFWVLRQGWGLKGVIMVEAFLFALQTLFLIVVYFLRVKRGEITERIRREYSLRRLAKYGAYCFFQDIGDIFFDTSTDIFVISSMGNNLSAGLYGMVVTIGMMLYRWSPLGLMMDIIRPVFFRRYAQLNSDESLKEMFSAIVKVQLAGVIPMFIGFVVLGRRFISLFFPQYTPIYPLLVLFLLFILIRGVRVALEMVIYALQRVPIILASKIFSLYNLLADILFFSIWGLTGVVLATGSASLFRYLYLWYRLRKELRLGLPVRAILILLLNSGIMAFFLYLLRNLATDYLSFFILVAGGVIIYLIALWFISPFSAKERAFLKSLLPKLG